MKDGYISVSNYPAESYVIFQDSRITHRLSVDGEDEEVTISLQEFLTTLGITLRDCEKALKPKLKECRCSICGTHLNPWQLFCDLVKPPYICDPCTYKEPSIEDN